MQEKKVVPVMVKSDNWFPWNGSKRWLLDDLAPILQSWNGEGTYIDPFVGGGSVSSLVRRLHPNTKQSISDANPWLMSAYESQLMDGPKISSKFLDIEYWRNVTDKDVPLLSGVDRANRFAVCLFTAWGNRWKSKDDGSMGLENPVNPKFTNPDYLKKRLESFFNVKWLHSQDDVRCSDWKSTVANAGPGDLVYLDPPYPESLGYGNQWWSFDDQLDVVDWVGDAVKQNINIVVSNMSTMERLYRRAGLSTRIVDGPTTSKTRARRKEVIAWSIAA